MKKQLFVTLCLFNLICFEIKAQQNFFNVVSSDITPKGNCFFQQQLNFTKTTLQSNTTMSYGLGHQFEVGFNYFGLNIHKEGRPYIEIQKNIPYSNFLMINAQKRFDINSNMAFAFGLQQGFTSYDISHWGGNYYANYIYSNEGVGLKMVSGLYYATKSFYGYGKRLFDDNIGLQLGIEKSIIDNKWYFQSDFISGEHSFSDIIIGSAFYISRCWVISAGYQMPTFKSMSQNATVIELTYVPKKL